MSRSPAISKVARLAGSSRRARAAYEASIVEALDAGHSTREVMRAAGLKTDSHVRHIRDKIKRSES